MSRDGSSLLRRLIPPRQVLVNPNRRGIGFRSLGVSRSTIYKYLPELSPTATLPVASERTETVSSLRE
ncbi:hypothetical protein ACWDYH_30975 [Nocardia goodfellowii]